MSDNWHDFGKQEPPKGGGAGDFLIFMFVVVLVGIVWVVCTQSAPY